MVDAKLFLTNLNIITQKNETLQLTLLKMQNCYSRNNELGHVRTHLHQETEANLGKRARTEAKRVRSYWSEYGLVEEVNAWLRFELCYLGNWATDEQSNRTVVTPEAPLTIIISCCCLWSAHRSEEAILLAGLSDSGWDAVFWAELEALLLADHKLPCWNQSMHHKD